MVMLGSLGNKHTGGRSDVHGGDLVIHLTIIGNINKNSRYRGVRGKGISVKSSSSSGCKLGFDSCGLYRKR